MLLYQAEILLIWLMVFNCVDLNDCYSDALILDLSVNCRFVSLRKQEPIVVFDSGWCVVIVAVRDSRGAGGTSAVDETGGRRVVIVAFRDSRSG